MTEPEDRRDPLRAAFDDYHPAPPDIVPKGAPWPIDHNRDLDALGNGEAVMVSHLEITDDGIAVSTRETVTRPVYGRKEN